jgi:predicted nucleic acid-binding Zn ribbon protein
MERKKRDPQKMADIVSQLMSRRGYDRLIEADEYRDAWEAVSGRLAEQSTPGNLRRGTLEIYVSSSIVMQELTFQKSKFLTALQQELPQKKITDLRFRIGTIG